MISSSSKSSSSQKASVTTSDNTKKRTTVFSIVSIHPVSLLRQADAVNKFPTFVGGFHLVICSDRIIFCRETDVYHDATPEFSGYLEKRGADVLRLYKTRWCELKGPFIKYSVKALEGDEKKEKGVIELDQNCSVSKKGDLEFIIEATPPDESKLKRTFELKAQSSEKRDLWVQKISDAINHFSFYKQHTDGRLNQLKQRRQAMERAGRPRDVNQAYEEEKSVQRKYDLRMQILKDNKPAYIQFMLDPTSEDGMSLLTKRPEKVPKGSRFFFCDNKSLMIPLTSVVDGVKINGEYNERLEGLLSTQHRRNGIVLRCMEQDLYITVEDSKSISVILRDIKSILSKRELGHLEKIRTKDLIAHHKQMPLFFDGKKKPIVAPMLDVKLSKYAGLVKKEMRIPAIRASSDESKREMEAALEKDQMEFGDKEFADILETLSTRGSKFEGEISAF